jgi:hypothetical protein
MTEMFGKTTADKLAEENATARKIVGEITQFGVNERQKYLIMYYMSLELENIEHVQEISSFLKELVPDLTITGIYEGNNK